MTAVNLYTHTKIAVLEAATGDTLASLMDNTALLPNFDKDQTRESFFTLLSPSFFKSRKLK